MPLPVQADRNSSQLTTRQWQTAVESARDYILSRRLLQPQIAIVLGSGVGEFADRVEHPAAIEYSSIPHFPQTTVAGHAGRLMLGYLAGVPVVLMQGRVHRYEGCTNLDIVFPVYCMHALGATVLIAINAAGGLNERFERGELMVLDGHIDMLWNRCARPAMFGMPPAIEGVAPYDRALLEHSCRVARQLGIVLHRGCYLATLGPTYETRAEYRMFRQLGADAVGMSTVPEILAAHRLGMRTLAFSVLTNVASTDVPQATTHAEVVSTGQSAGPQLMRLIEQLLQEVAGPPD